MKTPKNNVRLTLVILLSVFAVACDSVGPGGEEGPTLEVTGAEFNTSSDIIKVHFNAPLDESTVNRSAFRIFSVFDNGRAGRFTPESARFLGGTTNTVELDLWGDNGLGNGDHALIVTGIEDVDGNSNEVKYSFTHRVTIETPKSFIVRKFVVTEFPANEEDGSSWDDLSDGPDIRVSFQRPNATPIFVSGSFKDANSGSRYTFDDGGLPFEAKYTTEYLLNLIDEDFGGDKTMVTADINFANLYRLNNATSDELTVTLRRPRFTAVIHGDWTY